MSLLRIPSPSSRGFLVWSFFIAVAAGAALQNITIALPEGTTNHGDAGLLCFPTGWTDLITFYLGNYAAHATTVKFLPGEKVKDMIPTVVISLFFPAFGAFRGIMNCVSGAKFAKKKGVFHMAVRARALCMVIRGTNWTPAAGDEVRDVVIERCQKEAGEDAASGEMQLLQFISRANLFPSEEALNGDIAVSVYATPWAWSTMIGEISAWGREIYGDPQPPPGYEIVIVPWDAQVRPSPNAFVDDPLFTGEGGLKAVFGVIQALFAIVTLYEARGNQIDIFGSAAFGLTVIPYLLMSLLNILSGVFCPEYPSLFLVDSSILREARKRHGAKLDVTVGVLDEEDEGALQVGPDAKSLSLLGKPLTFQSPIKSSCSDSAQKQEAQATADITGDEDIEAEQKGKLVGSDAPKGFLDSVDYILQVATILPQQEQDGPSVNVAMKDMTGSAEAPSTPDLIAYIPSCRPYRRDPGIASSKDAYTIHGVNTKSSDSGARSRSQISTFTSAFMTAWRPVAVTDSCPRNALLGMIAFLLSFLVGILSLAIIAILSHFEHAQSTHAQRVWTMTWLCFGCFLGPIYSMSYGEVPFFSTTDPEFRRDRALKITIDIFKAFVGLMFATPAIGGLVVVGQMIWTYGICNQVG